MSSTRTIASSFALAAIAGLAIGFAAQRETRVKAETEHLALEQQLGTLRGIVAENAQLSNLVAGASAPKSPPADDSGELLRLRAEVSELRRQCANFESVLNENRQVHSADEHSSPTSPSDTTNMLATADFWPRDSWAFAGYATPDATVQSSLWAANNGDLNAVLASFTGKMQDSLKSELASKSENEVSVQVMDEVIGVRSVRVLDRSAQSDGTVLITASFQEKYDTRTRKLVLENVGGEWKIAGGQ